MTVHTDRIRRLADVLDTGAAAHPDNFDMRWFVSVRGPCPDYDANISTYRRHRNAEPPWQCGTVACALGWAPYALGEPLTYDEMHGRWPIYAHRVLGVPYEDFEGLFMDWSELDPTTGADGARAAARRLRAYADRVEAGDAS